MTRHGCMVTKSLLPSFKVVTERSIISVNLIYAYPWDIPRILF